jgi:biopolymer transport protein ExbD
MNSSKPGLPRKLGSKFRRASAQQNGEMGLNITAMADVFMLLLVFLLKTYASGAVAINPSADVSLPVGAAGSGHVEALQVEISKAGVLVESKPAATLQDFRFVRADLESNGVSKTLSAVFSRERQRQVLLSKSNEDVKPDSRLVVVADRKVPYSTIKSVLASAATHGYTDFKLAVFDKNN